MTSQNGPWHTAPCPVCVGVLGSPGGGGTAAEQGQPVGGVLRELQRLWLRPFLQHLWWPPGALDFECPDQQALIWQILATLDAASWGQALLVASLGCELGLGRVEPGGEGLLGELVEAVKDYTDRVALRRQLRYECAVCRWGLPRAQMQWLLGCSCPLCPECFRLHFMVGVQERGVGALGCPSCSRPNLRDEAQHLWYWSTLELQLQSCLDPDTFGFVTQKLMELDLLQDPQFRHVLPPVLLWVHLRG
ncbi:E3 ubiquitin-protein ligase RNF31 [Chiroxiphia lanceolata]|uniref:E3 ubiquitin-protein ligase RNF31 n=1 Tax=Chiroxiphia lanceolata TaxID=296741 RepID=UPI0013CE9E17|nr:E3 ubiquitin-protein ligase RNF31 [Chiroxiphia lanceolata]